MLYNTNQKKGFTFIELMLVIGVIAVLSSFAVINLYSAQQKSSITSTIDTLVADLKDQQMKSIVRDTEGQTTSSAYGIHFKSDRYILFRGYPYEPTDTTAATTRIENAVIVSTSFPGNQVSFASGSGEVIGAGATTHTVVLRDKNNTEQRTVSINALGTVISVN